MLGKAETGFLFEHETQLMSFYCIVFVQKIFYLFISSSETIRANLSFNRMWHPFLNKI